MFRLLFYGVSLFVAYRLGERQAQLNTHEFLLSRTTSPTAGVTLTDFVTISQSGEIDFTQDETLATPLQFYEAIQLKNLIKKYTPSANLQLLTSNSINLI